MILEGFLSFFSSSFIRCYLLKLHSLPLHAYLMVFVPVLIDKGKDIHSPRPSVEGGSDLGFSCVLSRFLMLVTAGSHFLRFDVFVACRAKGFRVLIPF